MCLVSVLPRVANAHIPLVDKWTQLTEIICKSSDNHSHAHACSGVVHLYFLQGGDTSTVKYSTI